MFLDTLVICSTTAMILLVSGVQPSEDISYVQRAVHTTFGDLGIHFITIAIFFFAFSSLIGNYFYTEANLRFIRDSRPLLFAFRVTCLIAIFLGAQAGIENGVGSCGCAHGADVGCKYFCHRDAWKYRPARITRL